MIQKPRRSGGRNARHALRAAPLTEEIKPVRKGMSGGKYKPLSDDGVAKVHESALDILENIGMNSATETCIAACTSVGAIYGEDGRLRFPRSVVEHALKIAKMREDSNFLLTTILWGNVGINVLLTLLSSSVMAGVVAFVFSTFIITFLGEVIPQAYFSRHAMQTASLLSPILRFYQFLLYPVAKPTSLVLEKWLGAEAIKFYQEKDLRELLKIHVDAPETDIFRLV